MAEDVIRIRLKPAQRRAVEAETGVDLEELTYPDPGGELSARFGEFDAGDILHWARAQALVIAYDRDAAAAREALERDLAQAEDDHASALEEIGRTQKQARERKATMLAEAQKGSKRRPRASAPDTADTDDDHGAK